MYKLTGQVVDSQWLYLVVVIIIIITRLSASVIKVGVAYVNVRVSKSLKKELAWATDKRLRVISNIMLV